MLAPMPFKTVRRETCFLADIHVVSPLAICFYLAVTLALLQPARSRLRRPPHSELFALEPRIEQSLKIL